MVKCFSYAGWKELRPVLEKLATEDEDDAVRAFAVQSLEAWDAAEAGALEASR
jgi:hypothetical protein